MPASLRKQPSPARSAAGSDHPYALGSLPQTRPHRQTAASTPVTVVAEQESLGSAAVLMASSLGYPATPYRQGQPDLDNGLALIVGQHFRADFLRLIMQGPWKERLDRVAIFGSDIGDRALAALDRAGYPFLVRSAPTPERLATILGTMAPESVDRRHATILRRNAAAAEIETGPERLFEHIRSGDLSAAVGEVRDAFDHFDALLDSAATAHWLSIIQAYHDGTAQHCSLVSAIAMLFARDLGFSANDQRRLFEAAHFHDVGKIEVPLAILDKPGAFTPEERRLMETHASAGYAILAGNNAIATEVAEAARDHHEYLDGSGYPYGIDVRSISDVTRMITISDIFAALIERRAYKQPRTAREAYSIMLSMEGRLDPTLLKAFGRIAESCSSD